MRAVGRAFARFLNQPLRGYEPATPPDFIALQRCIRPGDVLLVEGSKRISSLVKYFTQSTWSHAALYVGEVPGVFDHSGEPHVLVEAEIEEGVVSSPLSKYREAHVRICRPVALTEIDRDVVVQYVINRIGCQYDLRNVLDLARYLIPVPIPARLRRRMLAMGSRSPTRAICSTLIAQAFQHVHYPILPRVKRPDDDRRVKSQFARDEILCIRHYSLYSPRDFDLSPYFAVVKPTLETGFNYKAFVWGEDAPTKLHLSLGAAVRARELARQRGSGASLAGGRPPESLDEGVSPQQRPAVANLAGTVRQEDIWGPERDEDRWIQEVASRETRLSAIPRPSGAPLG